MTDQPKPKSKRGFAAMSAEKRSAIASLGGKAVRPEQRSFRQDRDLAKTAGILGGKATGSSKKGKS